MFARFAQESCCRQSKCHEPGRISIELALRPLRLNYMPKFVADLMTVSSSERL